MAYRQYSDLKAQSIYTVLTDNAGNEDFNLWNRKKHYGLLQLPEFSCS
jgi:hypothetical protein